MPEPQTIERAREMPERASPHPPRRENSYGKKYIMCAKANTEHALRNRPSPLDYRRRDEPESS
jgi:hypothetical protein